jgi:hypothetical protein
MANEYNSKVVLSDGTVLMDLTSDTVDAAHLLKNYTAHGKDGAPITGACEYDSDTSSDTAAVGEILSGKTAHARGSQLTGTMTNNGAIAEVIDDKDDVIVVPAGYHDGSGTVQLDSTEKAKLIATNIRQGITLLGVQGSMSGSESVNAQAKSATPTFSQQVISPDTGYTHLTQVTVAAIPISYADNAAGGVTVTIGSAS